AWWMPSAPAANTSSRPSADRADTTRPDSAGCTSGFGCGPVPGAVTVSPVTGIRPRVSAERNGAVRSA
ncbi:hypothetical protein, partial [Streptomyces venezuelae]|uniref:hypothetical protein n=1 Tax=Streptomyces venezuelae TaxID=54571 RepID=UPI001F26CC9B